MDQNLRVALDPLIKLFVSSRRLVDRNFVGDDKAWIRLSRDYHIS